MKFIDDDGCILVPKSVRPLIDYHVTQIGNRNGALRQFRHGKLHIREYDDYYSVHSDKVDPRYDPIGHLVVDAPEYLVSAFFGLLAYSLLENDVSLHLGKNDLISSKQKGKDLSSYLFGILAAYSSYSLTKSLKKAVQ